MDEASAPMHPRPTLTRDWASLDGPWQFTVGAPGDDPLTLAYDQSILVPFAPESAASGIGLDTCEHPRYRRTFSAAPAEGQRLLLHFEAVDHEARVWVDGQLVGEHEGGYLPFTFDITDALADGEEHELVVAASDDAQDLEIPRGKQAWTPQPEVIWYRRSSGIWRSVWLEEVPATHIERVTWTPLDDLGTLLGAVDVAGWRPGLTVEASFSQGGVHLGSVAAEAIDTRVDLALNLASPRTKLPEQLLWSPESPRLVDIQLRVLDGETELDAAASYTGLRTVGAEGGHVTINGRPVYQRLVLEQAYWPETGFTAPSEQALRAEAELIRDLGFNGLRMHQVTADPRFLRICDELGLLVWADLPAAYLFSDRALERTTANLHGLVARDRNHPSVIAWVPFNESWGLPDLPGALAQRNAVVSLHALAKALDPSRIALGNDGWEHVTGDLIGVHDYTHNPKLLRRRYAGRRLAKTLRSRKTPGNHILLLGHLDGRPTGQVGTASAGVGVLLSEFGGVSLDSDPAAWRGYGGVQGPDELVRQVVALVGAVGPASGLAGFCWTQLTDTMQEQNGLAWPDRTPKADAAALHAALTQP